MSHFDDLYVEFLSPVIADEAIAIRREAVELLGDDTPIYDRLTDIMGQDTPIEVRLSEFDAVIIESSDEFLKEYIIEVIDTTGIALRSDIVRTIKEVGYHLDPELIVETIEACTNAIESFGELCALFGQQDATQYILSLHYVADHTLEEIVTNARDKADRIAMELHQDVTLLDNFSKYISTLDERTKSHYRLFAEGLCECYTLFIHGMGLYVDEIKQDLEDDHGIACLKIATLYALSKDKESVTDENLVKDLTASIGAFIVSDYLNKIVATTYTILKEALSYGSNEK